MHDKILDYSCSSVFNTSIQGSFDEVGYSEDYTPTTSE